PWPGAAGQRQRRGNLSRGHRLDPEYAMGGLTVAGVHPWADLPLDHSAAVFQAHVAAVDELVCGDHHGHGAGVAGGCA
nr:hypothetical protein [Tanacetum cinerariifolium]